MDNITLMIINNQPYFRSGIRQILAQNEGLGELEIFECDPGPDGNEGIYQIAERSPDIILLDIEYPFLTGLGLCKKIARSFPGPRVIMFSVNPEEDDDELFEAIRVGAAAYIKSRTCSPQELATTVRRVFNGEYPINDLVNCRPKLALRVLKQFQEMAALEKSIEQIITPLTSREVQVLRLVAEGNSNKSIGRVLKISEQNVKNQVSGILRKLNANDRAHAVFIAICNRMISAKDAGDKICSLGKSS